MKRKNNDFALGLTALLFLALFLATLLFIYPALHGRGRQLEIVFPHASGMAPLKPGSPVVLGGSLQVGRVLSVQLRELPGPGAHSPPDYVFSIRVELRPDLPLRGDMLVTTDQPAIGGGGSVTILNLGTPGVPVQEPIHGLPPQSFSAAIGTLSRRLLTPGGPVDDLVAAVDPDTEGSLMHKLLTSMNDVNAMTSTLRVQLDPDEQRTLMGKLQLVLDNLNATTAALRGQLESADDTVMLGKAHRALDQISAALQVATQMLEENRPLVLDTVTNLQHASATLDRELLATLRSELDPANPGSLSGKAHTAMDLVNQSLGDVRAITSEGERMMVVSRPTLEKTLANFQSMSEQLRLTSQEVLLNPSKLLWAPNSGRQEQMLVFQAARSFAEAAGELDNAAGRLEAVMRTLPPDGQAGAKERQELRAIHDSVRAAFQRFERAESALWEQLK